MPDDLDQLAGQVNHQSRWGMPPQLPWSQTPVGSTLSGLGRQAAQGAARFASPLWDPSAHGGIAGMLEGAGYSLPQWMTAPQTVLNNPSFNQALELEAGIPWKPAELATLRNMVASGRLDPSQLPGRTAHSIYSKLENEGLSLGGRKGEGRQPPPSLVRDQEKVDRLMQMMSAQNMTIPQMAERLGVSPKTLNRYIGETLRVRQRRAFGGEWNNPQRIQQYKDMIAGGWSVRQMAKALGIGPGGVSEQLAMLREAGLVEHIPGGGTRTPSMPSFRFQQEEVGEDPEYERSLLEYLKNLRR